VAVPAEAADSMNVVGTDRDQEADHHIGSGL